MLRDSPSIMIMVCCVIALYIISQYARYRVSAFAAIVTSNNIRVKNAILTAVKDAGPNACPPMVVGVGVGGTFEKCAFLAKKALTRNVLEHSDIEYVKELEEEMLDKINKLGIGPGGLGGTKTALAVNIETYPTHIAGLPVAVNICCHVNRHSHRVL